MNKEGNYIIKNGSSVSTILTTGFMSLILSNESFLSNSNFKLKYLKNIFYMIISIRDSNISLPNINTNEITSGIFNPDGLLNLLLNKLQNYEKKIRNRKLNELNSNISYINNSSMLNNTNSNNYENNDVINYDNNTTTEIIQKIKSRIYLFNNILDYSLVYHNNFTISSKNKPKNKKYFYSTKQPELESLIFFQRNLNHHGENSIKMLNDIKVVTSKRKSDIFQCLKVYKIDF